MRKIELVDRVVDVTNVGNSELGINREVATACVNAAIAVIANAVARGEQVTLREFGTFKPHRRNAKTARDIGAGTPMLIPAHMIPLFEPSAAFKQMVRSSQPIEE